MTRLAILLLLLPIFVTSCDDDDDTLAPRLDVPDTYSFERNGSSTVDFSGQTTRIAMAEEVVAGLTVPTSTELQLDNMFRNAGPNGEDVAPFSDAALNASEKSVRSKVAASRDYFFVNATDAAAVRSDFDGWIAAQVAEVFPRWNELAAPGQAGQIADGNRTRYVNAQGLEYDQAFAKSLIGALMIDQALNNYLSPAVLDEATNRADNDAGITVDGQPYTSMEHKWDEAYGYVFGAAPSAAEPLATLGQDDNFLNKYLSRVEDDPDYAGIADELVQAFTTGRAAIVAGDYAERDRQAEKVQELISRIVGIRTVYYLAQGAAAIENEPGRGPAFHDLSEAYGFLYSLQFTREPGTGAPYFSRAESLDLIDQMVPAGNGMWDVTPTTLRELARTVADRFNLNYAAAAE
jgi:hypothetical protein